MSILAWLNQTMILTAVRMVPWVYLNVELSVDLLEELVRLVRLYRRLVRCLSDRQA
jgi:hypothetical protein